MKNSNLLTILSLVGLAGAVWYFMRKSPAADPYPDTIAGRTALANDTGTSVGDLLALSPDDYNKAKQSVLNTSGGVAGFRAKRAQAAAQPVDYGTQTSSFVAVSQ